MTVTHSAQARNDMADAILALIDAGAGAGKLVFRATGQGAEIATLVFSNPAGTVTGPTLTWSAITSDTSATGGTVADASIEDDSAGAVVLTDAVQVSGGDIDLSSLVIGAGDTVSCSALSWTAPA